MGRWRLLLGFSDPTVAVIIDVGEHRDEDPARVVYHRLYEALAVDPPCEPRDKPPCCDETCAPVDDGQLEAVQGRVPGAHSSSAARSRHLGRDGLDDIGAEVEEAQRPVGGTTWRGRRLMRVSISNWSTTAADVDRSVEAILRVAAGV
ncbi:hypothetical protein BH18ACT4_BH18ACT4_01090 [soil metagenome]